MSYFSFAYFWYLITANIGRTDELGFSQPPPAPENDRNDDDEHNWKKSSEAVKNIADDGRRK